MDATESFNDNRHLNDLISFAFLYLTPEDSIERRLCAFLILLRSFNGPS